MATVTLDHVMPVVVEYLLYALTIAVAIALGFYFQGLEDKRKKALQLIASQLGLSFAPAQDRSLPRTYSFLNRFQAGENR